jgi:DNA polymerase III subunit delta
MTVLNKAAAETYVARPDPARPIVLLYGPDSGLVSERSAAILRAGVEDPRDVAVTQIPGDELAGNPALLVDEAQAIPMFGGRPTILVRAGGRGFLPALEMLVKADVRDARVVIEAGDLKKSAPLRAFCEKAPSIAVISCYPDDAAAIGRLIDAELRAAELAVAPDARAALLQLLGADRGTTRNELRKLALYAHGSGTVTLDDVVAVIGDASALAQETVVDAAFAGRASDVDAQFARLLNAGTQPAALVGAALRQAYQLHKIRLAVESGSPLAEALPGNLFFQRKDNMIAAAKQWTAARLLRAIEVLAEAARDIRMTRGPAEPLARDALLRLARGARGAG